MRNHTYSHVIQHEANHQCCFLLHTSINSDYITGQLPKNSDFTTGRVKKFAYSPQSAFRVWGTTIFLYFGYRGGPLPEVKRPWRETDHPAPAGTEGRKRGAVSSLSLTPVALFITRGKTLPLPCLLFVFVIFLCCSAVITCLDITNAVILKVTGTHCLNDKWRGSYDTLYYCNDKCVYIYIRNT